MVGMTPRFRTLALLAACTLLPAAAGAEIFLDVGAHSTRVEADIVNAPEKTETTSSGLHLGVGVRRELKRGSIGARLELDDLDSDSLLGVRALDYRRHLSERIALTGFIGAARLSLATPAYGYYLGGGVELKELLRAWDLGLDVRLGDKIARDNVLPTDPQGNREDSFYDLRGVSLYLRYRF